MSWTQSTPTHWQHGTGLYVVALRTHNGAPEYAVWHCGGRYRWLGRFDALSDAQRAAEQDLAARLSGESKRSDAKAKAAA